MYVAMKISNICWSIQEKDTYSTTELFTDLLIARGENDIDYTLFFDNMFICLLRIQSKNQLFVAVILNVSCLTILIPVYNKIIYTLAGIEFYIEYDIFEQHPHIFYFDRTPVRKCWKLWHNCAKLRHNRSKIGDTVINYERLFF